MEIFLKVTKGIDHISEYSGKAVSLLTLLMVLATFVVVVMRYVFNEGSIPLQESIIYMHGLVFLVGSAFTLKHNGHVRVDIFYRNFSKKRKAIVDAVGTLVFMLPVTIFIFVYSFDFVAASWSSNEGSSEVGGLPGLYLLKSTLLIMAVLLALQGISEALKALLTLAGVSLEQDDEDSHHV